MDTVYVIRSKLGGNRLFTMGPIPISGVEFPKIADYVDMSGYPSFHIRQIMVPEGQAAVIAPGDGKMWSYWKLALSGVKSKEGRQK
jgi:hypothetical protein